MTHTYDLNSRVTTLEASVLSIDQTEKDIPFLEGVDKGLYSRLGFVASRLGYQVEDDDNVTKEILTEGMRGINKTFLSGDMIMVKQGSPLQMSAILAHEIGHHFTPPIVDWYTRMFAEVVAEGVAYTVCDYHGLDITPQAALYVARFRKDKLTAGMRDSIVEASETILEHMQEAA